MFELTKEEFANLMSKNLTSSWGGRRKLPKVFTEQGIYMLMTVLRGELAIKQSKALIRTFKKMKDYIIDNSELIGQREYIQLSMQTAENVRDISKLKSDMGSLKKQMSDVMNQLSDVVTKSDLADMMNSFVDDEDNGWLMYNTKYCTAEYPSIKMTLKMTGGIYHDRFIVLDYGTEDERIFLCGASSKDAGAKVTGIVEDFGIGKYKILIDKLLKNEEIKLT